jgi:hypothetical protein
MHTVEARETVASEVRFESRSHVSGLVRISGWRCPQRRPHPRPTPLSPPPLSTAIPMRLQG